MTPREVADSPLFRIFLYVLAGAALRGLRQGIEKAKKASPETRRIILWTLGVLGVGVLVWVLAVEIVFWVGR